MAAGSITVLGLGPGGLGLIPMESLILLKKAPLIIARTEKHPAVSELRELGLKISSFDFLYEEKGTFESVYEAIVQKLLSLTKDNPEIIYAVPGHPLVAETTVPLLKEAANAKGINVSILPAMSCLDAIYAALAIDPTKGIVVKDALVLDAQELTPALGLIITQLYDRRIASEVKLTLMDKYPDDYEVTLIQAAGVKNMERKETIRLYELDRIPWIDHLTSLYLPPGTAQNIQQTEFPLDPLTNVMRTLLSENGCPWDKEQTHESLKRYLIEECYEVIEAIEEQNMYKLCDELGDLLLQIVFHAELADQKHSFNMNDVIEAVTNKMIRRHPHVFGEVHVENSDEVLVNWDEIKKLEKNAQGQKTLMDIPRGLPALYRAEKVQNRAAKVGFDWPNIKEPWNKVQEELKELETGIANGDLANIREEIGDVLFSVVNVSRFLKVDPEEALQQTIVKFIKRFRFIEKEAQKQELELQELSLEEMDKLWEKAKNY
ncbi:nucleoside triphosphate pyrophosphohydrolase [Bacillota bacterium LX-D]|nr:nucleoside triphosphate pyrophosphohydrolase [Bacillota bacterium LX-D]